MNIQFKKSNFNKKSKIIMFLFIIITANQKNYYDMENRVEHIEFSQNTESDEIVIENTFPNSQRLLRRLNNLRNRFRNDDIPFLYNCYYLVMGNSIFWFLLLL